MVHKILVSPWLGMLCINTILCDKISTYIDIMWFQLVVILYIDGTITFFISLHGALRKLYTCELPIHMYLNDNTYIYNAFSFLIVLKYPNEWINVIIKCISYGNVSIICDIITFINTAFPTFCFHLINNLFLCKYDIKVLIRIIPCNVIIISNVPIQKLCMHVVMISDFSYNFFQ